jgi:glycine/D-amino acid oxidase-like deaminating enzyme
MGSAARPVIIIGAGVVGLTLAHGLQKVILPIPEMMAASNHAAASECF